MKNARGCIVQARLNKEQAASTVMSKKHLSYVKHNVAFGISKKVPKVRLNASVMLLQMSKAANDFAMLFGDIKSGFVYT